MKELLTPDLVAAVFALLQNPSTYCWAVLFVAGFWMLSKLCTALTELVKVFKPSK